MTHTAKTFAMIAVAGVAIAGVTMSQMRPSAPTSVRTVAERPELPQVEKVSSLSMADSLAALSNLDAAFQSIVEYALPAVVHIRASNTRNADSQGRFVGPVAGSGSGVIVRPDGYIVTNDHVVGGFDQVQVILNDGRELSGKVFRAPDSDLAVIKVDATDLPSLRFADSSSVRPGQFAIAIGSPFGLENSVTVGHISGLSRATEIGDSRLGRFRGYPDLIQTDAAINQGNSGGPLLNIRGEVIGINTAIFSRTGGSIGVGFAIPATTARLVVDQLIERGKVVRGFMGVGPETLREFERQKLGLDGGAKIEELEAGGPAARAGLRKGDVVTRIGSTPIRTHSDLRNTMLKHAPGETVEVEYVREGRRSTTRVQLGEPPAAPELPARQIQPNRIDPRSMPDLRQFRDLFPDMFDMLPDLRDRNEPGQRPERDEQPLGEPVRLGVQVETVNDNLRRQFSIPANVRGAVVTSVDPGSRGATVGLRPGDVITRFGDRNITAAGDLVEAMRGVSRGDTVQISYSRFGPGSAANVSLPITFR